MIRQILDTLRAWGAYCGALVIFKNPAELAHAFEQGPALDLRWQKTLRQAERHGFDASAVRSALTSPTHQEVAGVVATPPAPPLEPDAETPWAI